MEPTLETVTFPSIPKFISLKEGSTISRVLLISIRISHYCEKVRWAMDYFMDQEYDEHVYMPGMHIIPVMLYSKGHGKQDHLSTNNSTPCVVVYYKDGTKEIITDSTDMLYFIDEYHKSQKLEKSFLFPDEKVRQLEAYFSYHIGAHSRRAAYFQIFKYKPTALIDCAFDNVSSMQAYTFKFSYKVVKKRIIEFLNVTEEEHSKSIKALLQIFDEVVSLLQQNANNLDEQGKEKEIQFLVGNSLTAADIAVCALSAPVLRISNKLGYGANLSQCFDCVPQEFFDQFTQHKAGQYALKLWQHHRGTRKKQALPLLQ